MLSVLQICLLSVIGILAIASIVFTILFVVEISVKEKKTIKKVSIKKVIEENKKKEEELQISVDEMLENLEKQTKEEAAKVEETQEVLVAEVENVQPVETEEVEKEINIVEEADSDASESIEEIATEEKEEVIEEAKNEVADAEEVQEIEDAGEIKSEEILAEIQTTEEVVIDKEPEEKVEEIKIEDVAEVISEDDEDDSDDDEDTLTYEKLEPEIILAPGTVIDYKSRLEKVISSKGKLERDLAKIQKFILKYERTDRRKARNQKMLDRRAGELTNLNLVMYSVTDIKNVDEEKKVKQEELTSHIAELKASIQDAEEYLDSNKEKYAHNVKMAKFLSQERVRFAEEIAELEALIKAADENK